MRVVRSGVLGIVAAAIASAIFTAPPAIADDWEAGAINFPRDSIAYFQAYDQRLQDVGWKLIRGNADFCEHQIASIGLQLQDVSTFGKPDVARRALKLSGDFAVATSAKGSPAEASGALTQNREITQIGEIDPNAIAPNRKARWERLKRVHDALDAIAQRGEGVSITFADGATTEIMPVRACAARFELAGDGNKLVANDERVLIGIESRTFTYLEDMFASGLAHELAHTILRHSTWLDRNGRKGSHTRMTELEADRLMPWLLFNAGYDPAAAARFLRDYRPYDGGLLFVRGSHPRWRERVAAVEAELAKLRELTQREGHADWRTHFQREIDPDKAQER